MTTAEHYSAHSASFVRLLLESGLVTREQLALARDDEQASGVHVEESLLRAGVLQPDLLRRVMSRSWGLPVVDLAVEWIDTELVRNGGRSTYLREGWMPVRDQANGTVLVAIARLPDESRSAEIGAALASPVEFAVATSLDIREALQRVFDVRRRRWFL